MPIIKSAKKRARQTEKRTIRNVKTKRSLREAIKSFTQALATGKADTISEAQKKANSAIDQAAKKNIIHKNKAARKKSQLNTQAKHAAGAAPKKAAKPAAKKPVAKATKAAPKKAAKPVAKKTAAKKPAKK